MTGARALTFIEILLSGAGPAAVVAISYHFSLGLELQLFKGIVRSASQLFLAGFVLLSFIFSQNSLLFTFGYLSLMALVACIEVTARQTKTYGKHFQDSFVTIILSGGLVGLYGSLIVFRPEPWYNPKIIVPTAGMLLGNSISGPSVSVGRLLSEVTEKTHEVEVRLTLGATSFEAVLPSIRSSLLTALTPHLNMLSVVGLVAIPGMMVGQMLGGSPPFVAAEYQLAILWLNTTVVGIGTLVGVFLACRNAVFDSSTHRLTLHKIYEKTKMDIFSAITFYVKRTFCMRYESKPTQLPNIENKNILRAPLSGNSSSNPPSGDYSLVMEDDSVHTPSSSLYTQGRKGKASYILHEGGGEGNATVRKCVLDVQNFNVKSGEELLFSHDEGLNVKIFEGDRIVISGSSGLGKTRLLRCLSKLEEVAEGHISIYSDGILNQCAMSDNSIWRSHVIYVPQALPPLEGHPLKLILETLKFNSRTQLYFDLIAVEVVKEYVMDIEGSLGLASGKMEESWSSMSGGERQRCAIAVAMTSASLLVSHSKLSSIKGRPGSIILLLDEPTGACDAKTTIDVERALTSRGFTVILVSHDPIQQERFGTRRIILTEEPSKGRSL